MPSIRVRWSEQEARKPYARPFMVTFSGDDGADVGSVALNGADLLYYTQFQTAVLSLAGELFVDTAVEASADPQRAWLDRVAGLIPDIGAITITPRSTFDDNQGRVFRLVISTDGRLRGDRRRLRSPGIPGVAGGHRPSDGWPLSRPRDRGHRGRRRPAPGLDGGAAPAHQAPGSRRGDERGLALGVSMTTYARAVAALDSVAWRGIMPGLERTRALLAALGNPHVGLRGALVAGTNGKGSVCATVDAVCRAAGYRSVLLTSPHLVSYCERIVRDGAPLTDTRVRSAGRACLGGRRGTARRTPADRLRGAHRRGDSGGA